MIFLNSLEQRIAPLLVLNYEKIEEINKPFKLTLRATKGLEKNDRIIFEEKEYVVTGVEEINGQDLTVEIYAEESITELSGNLILDKRPTSLLAAFQAITENTRWNIGSYPATTGKSLSFFRINSLEALNQTLEAYGLEMETEYNFGSPISRTLHLRNRVGESRGRRTTLHTDAIEVKRIVHDDAVITRLYGYGKGESLESGGYGRRLDISSVNGGLEYIEDNNARLAYGIGADRLHRDAVLIYEDIEDPNELKTAMIADFEILKTPKATYDGTMADLGLFDDKLGDDITILDEVLGIAVKGRILKLVKTHDKKQVTIGSLLPSFRSEIDRIKDIENRIRDFDVLRNAVVNLDNLDYLDGVIDRINTELNATTGFASLIPGRGIVIPNASDEASATQVIELGGGYWRIANSKDAFGNWEYRTIADGRGIIATEIIAGILKGGQVEFNLEAGTFIVGNPSDPNLYWDGANLLIKGDNIDLTGNQSLTLKVEAAVADGINQVEIGGRNYLRNSAAPISTTAYDMKDYPLTFPIVTGETYTIQIKGELGAGKTAFGIYNSGAAIIETELYPSDKNANGIFTKTFVAFNQTRLNEYIRIFQMTSDVTVLSSIEWIKLEKGNVATDWTPAPEDMEEAITSVSTTLTQTTNAFQMEFEKIVPGDGTSFNDYIRFEDGNIILGSLNQQLTLTIRNDKIYFSINGEELAYFSDSKLYVNQVEAQYSMAIGNDNKFSFVPRGNGNLSLV